MSKLELAAAAFFPAPLLGGAAFYASISAAYAMAMVAMALEGRNRGPEKPSEARKRPPSTGDGRKKNALYRGNIFLFSENKNSNDNSIIPSFHHSQTPSALIFSHFS